MISSRLLVIAHSYSTFVKGPTDALSPYYSEITVLVRLNPLAEFFSLLPLQFLQPYTRLARIDHSMQPPNLRVVETPIWYLPFDSTYKRVGLQHFKAVDRYIVKSRSTFDIMHAHFTYSAGFAAARIKEKYGIPFVLTAHGYDVYDLPFKDRSWRETITGVLDGADHIIAVSNSNRDVIRQLDIHTPVTVIPNGFDSRRFFPADMKNCRRQLGLPLNDTIIVSIGNLLPVKGHAYLIESVHHLIEEGYDIKCYIIGSGTLKTSLERQIKELGLGASVTLAGQKPHAEIPFWINASDFMVLPSLHEGNPTVMFEALGCGKPFIGTRVGGVPDIISSREYGLLAEPAAPGMLAAKIREAADIEWDRDRIVQYAQRFTWNQIAGEIGEIHRKVAGRAV